MFVNMGVQAAGRHHQGPVPGHDIRKRDLVGWVHVDVRTVTWWGGSMWTYSEAHIVSTLLSFFKRVPKILN